MRLVVLGPPGAGKGTQGRRLAADLGVPHIATGDMFRALAHTDSPLGHSLKVSLDAGELIPDGLTNQLVEERLGQPDAAAGFVFDGYPRTLDQAKVLDGVLAAQGKRLDKAIKFMVTGPEIVARLSGRWACPVDGSVYHPALNPPKVPGICDLDGATLVQREDDREETLLRRLEIYGEQTKPVYEFYAEQGILESLDAIGGPEDVHQRLIRIVGPEAMGGAHREGHAGPGPAGPGPAAGPMEGRPEGRPEGGA